VDDIRRIIQSDAAFGFALRNVVDKDVKATDLFNLRFGSPLQRSTGRHSGITTALARYMCSPKGYGYLFAEARLQEPLKLRLRGDKEALLENCKCHIPVLNTEARSLNHAFTLLSMKFETKRISHSGNVFARVYCYSEKRKEWHPLDELRGHFGHLLPNPP
jgi:hypothetical protein